MPSSQPSPPRAEALPLGLKLTYAFGNFGFSMLLSTVSFFLLFFYTDVVGVAPALASSALLIGKIWDIVNDPLFGWLTDRTHSRFGRRRVYLIFGAAPMALTTFLLWSMPPGLSPAWAFLWIALSYILFDTCFTLTQVPYWALAPELTQDYDERTSLTAITGFGLLFGFFGGSILLRLISGRFADPHAGYLVAGAVVGGLVGGVLGFAAWRIREPAQFRAQTTNLPIFAAIRATFRNRPFNFLLAAFSLARLGFMLTTTFLAYFVTYQLQAPGKLPLTLLVNMTAIGVFIFFWKWVSDRTSKGMAYAFGLVVMAAALALSFRVQPGQLLFFFLIIALIGVGNSAHWVIPLAMLPDVVEEDELHTGQRREGMYYGVYGLADKIMRTLGVVGAGWVLQGFGYVAHAAQTPQALLGIRLFFGLLPAILILLALPFLFFYPVSRRSHADLRRRLERPESPAAG